MKQEEKKRSKPKKTNKSQKRKDRNYNTNREGNYED